MGKGQKRDILVSKDLFLVALVDLSRVARLSALILRNRCGLPRTSIPRVQVDDHI